MQDEGATFGYDTNKITIFDAAGNEYESPLASKKKLQNILLMLFVKKKMIKNKAALLLLLLAAALQLHAQELQSKVTVLTQQLPNSVNKQRFTTLATQLTNLINNRQWTKMSLRRRKKLNAIF